MGPLGPGSCAVPGSEVRYGLNGGNSEGLFSIHPTTGIITLAAPLDYEVADMGNPVTCQEILLPSRLREYILWTLMEGISSHPHVRRE
ncbi:hypothetical protein Pmani_013322 [Petrolisthes manimaculis]|uniref:Uncharacterized protein n=1 Tax=Petrolisthes manimaculis TaxID=1843537 RepID=A0AAE1PV31_9EUCA|nr:hypothetical protein Pmani_013322 [Petrolisthes manimaculis]